MIKCTEAENFVLCHEDYLNKAYSNCICNQSELHFCCKVKADQFAVDLPHIIDPTNVETCNESELEPLKKSKTRKRKHPLNAGEEAALHYHKEVYPRLSHALEYFCNKHWLHKSCILHAAKETDHTTSDDTCDHNGLNKICFKGNSVMDMLISNGYMLTNCSSQPLKFIYKECEYLCPSKSQFLLSDIYDIQPLVTDAETHGKFNCIVADPPWENKSVKRGRKYCWLTNNQIKNLLPVANIASDKCLIVLWVTNNQRIMKFVRESLLPAWGFKYLTEWHWVKVSQSGKPVFPFDSSHKKPYETLVIGCNPGFSEYLKAHDEINVESKVIFSVPCVTHSHKPPLSEVLNPIFKSLRRVRCVELFARNLLPGWVSWGNEVLKMQSTDYFEIKKL